MNGRGLTEAVQPLPKDRVLTLRTLLKLTDELRAHVLGGRLQQAAEVQAQRDALLHAFFEHSVGAAERNAMIEACCAMLDMDRAVLGCLEISRAETSAQLLELRQSFFAPGSAAGSAGSGGSGSAGGGLGGGFGSGARHVA